MGYRFFLPLLLNAEKICEQFQTSDNSILTLSEFNDMANFRMRMRMINCTAHKAKRTKFRINVCTFHTDNQIRANYIYCILNIHAVHLREIEFIPIHKPICECKLCSQRALCSKFYISAVELMRWKYVASRWVYVHCIWLKIHCLFIWFCGNEQNFLIEFRIDCELSLLWKYGLRKFIRWPCIRLSVCLSMSLSIVMVNVWWHYFEYKTFDNSSNCQ